MRDEVRSSKELKSEKISMGRKKNLNKKMPLIDKIILAIIFFCFVAVIGIKAAVELGRGSPNPMRTLGNSKAPIRIVEYIDLQCLSCAKGSQALREYMKEHPGIIFLELKYFPINYHKNSLRATIYSECAGKQGKFWPFIDNILDQQEKWKDLNNPNAVFEQIARNTQLNTPELFQCIQDPKIKDAVLEAKSYARSIGIDTAPTYYINSKILIGHESLIQEIENQLREK